MISRSLILAGAVLAGLSSGASAAILSFTPGSAPVAISPPFGPLAPGGAAGTSYKNFGVDFTFGNVEGYFNDGGGILAFGGINNGGNLDLLTNVNGRIVVAGTLNQGVTNFLYAEAGFAAAGSLTLQAFNVNNVLIGSAVNGNPLGAFGRTTFSISTPGIAFFNITGNDTYGVNQIRLESPIAVAAGVPEPSTWAMMLLGFCGLAFASSRRKAALAA